MATSTTTTSPTTTACDWCEPERELASIGNLSSQFFGNVVLDELDQFIKHDLKVRAYVRYVDDFVLLAPDAQTLTHWHVAIAAFLESRLCLRLKPGARPRPIRDGIDFLGYIVRPRYLLARRRVVRRCWSRLRAFEARYLRRHANRAIRPDAGRTALSLDLRHAAALQSQLASYLGHFRHAASGRLWARLLRRFDWLRALFVAPARALPAGAAQGLAPLWRLPTAGRRLSGQLSRFRQRLRALARAGGLSPFELCFQCGNRWRRHGCPQWMSWAQLQSCCRALRAQGRSIAILGQTGVQRDGRRQRELLHLFLTPQRPCQLREPTP